MTILHISNEPLLIPSNTDLICRVAAEGYREWLEGKKKGKHIRLLAGSRMILTVELQPLR